MTNREAFERFAPSVERFFANKVAEPAAVEDLLHETFQRLFDRRAEAKIDNLRAFIFGVAKNVLLEYWRARSKARRSDELGELSIADLSQGLPSRVSHAEKLTLVRELLRELPLNHQMVLELHYWEGYSYKDIAAVLDVPVGTVATWARAGRGTLEQKLAEAWGESSPEDTGGTATAAGESVDAYSWYEPVSGSIDLLRLARDAMVGARAEVPTEVPSWLTDLQLPQQLPDASASDLSEISKAAWNAWVIAGRPTG